MNPPKMPIHIGDYKRDTGHLRAAGHGAYLLLLFHHWSTGSLPDDDDQLSAIACMDRREWKRMRPLIEKFFQPGWIHGRVVTDLSEAKESYEKLASAGSKGGKARAENKRRSSEATSEACSVATATLNQPLTFNQSKKEDPADAGSKYAFESGQIRLNQRDFDLWQASYAYIELRAELLARTDWAETLGPKRWFHAMQKALANKNTEVKAAKERAAEPQQPFKWNGTEGAI